MAIKSGFFNSLNGDRKYDAVEVGRLFDGFITNGVFTSYGNHFLVSSTNSLTVNVAKGKAWFNSTYLYTDAVETIQIDAGELLYNRIDAIVLDINSSVGTRQNTIKYIKGTPATVPTKPSMIKSLEHNQYPLCYITVDKEVRTIGAEKIENTIGTSECPFIMAIDKDIDVDGLLAQWDADFDIWFDKIKGQLSTDAAGRLQVEIDGIRDKLNRGQLLVTIEPQQWRSLDSSDLFKFGVKCHVDVNWVTSQMSILIDKWNTTTEYASLQAYEAHEEVYLENIMGAESFNGNIRVYAKTTPTKAVKIKLIVLSGGY